MMGLKGKKKLIKDISANTLQTGITQVFGLIIFYLTSKYLTKSEFGEFNWSLATGSTIIAFGTLGLDLVFVKRVASGQNVVLMAGIHFFHTVLTGVLLCLLVLSVNFIFPAFTQSHPLFFIVFANLAISNVANSFKLCLNGLELYRKLALIALISNVFKLIFVVLLYANNQFTVYNVVLAYLGTSLLELILSNVLLNKSISGKIRPVLKLTEYKDFIAESLPQLGVVVFDSALARVDWILLGILSSAVATAEYSFVYKIFELSKFPLLIVAPVLLTRFSKLFVVPDDIDNRNRSEIQMFFKLELFLIMIVPIILICIWSPLIDYFTNNKYGSVNEINYWILAPCVPFVCLINFLWTLGFVQGQLKTIMFITISVSLLNIISNSIFIPLYGQIGASLSFLISTILQLLLYLIYIKQDKLKLDIAASFVAIASAILSIVIAKLLTDNVIFTSLVAIMFYTLTAFLTHQINVKQLRHVMSKGV
ncbi:MAG: oligosaccharide flippase family protein [Bacteroidia bacterium]|nr:oligosaccharide flippase family protein [Bacteroidia bacterium]